MAVSIKEEWKDKFGFYHCPQCDKQFNTKKKIAGHIVASHITGGENKIVDLHHYDKDRENNSPENLIPLCPTHHQYVHSRYKDEVMGIIDDYRDNFIEKPKNA